MTSYAEYVVTHPYTPQHDGEIALAFGDKLCDVKDLGNGWVLAKNLTSNCVGIFPQNHVGLQLDQSTPTGLTSGAPIGHHESESPYYTDHNQTEVKTPVPVHTNNSLSSLSQLDSVSHTPKKPPATPIKPSSSRDSLSSASISSSRQLIRRSERGRSPATSIRQSPVAPRRGEKRHSLRIRQQDYPSQASNLGISPTASSPNLLLTEHPADNNAYHRSVLAPSTTNPSQSSQPQPVQPISAPFQHEHNPHPSQQVPPSTEKPQVAVRPNANRVIFSPSSRENLNSQDFDDLPTSASEVNVSDQLQSPAAYVNARPVQTAQSTPLSQRIRVGAPRGYVALSESQNRLPLYIDIDASSIDMQNTSNAYRESPENDAAPCRKLDDYRDYRSSKYPFSDDRSASYACMPRSSASLARQQRNTARDRNDGFKTVLSLIVSLILGGLLFLWLFYELLYILPAAAAIAILAAIIMCCAFALSIHCRCLAALLLPNLFTKIGRVAYLCILSGLLISGPIMNIYGNVREASASMSCSAELTYNQTKQIYALMYQPYSAILSGLNETVSKLHVAAGNVTHELHPLKQGLRKAQTRVNEGHSALYDTHATCRKTMKQAYSECSQGIQSAHGRCMDVMDALGNVYNHAISVLDRLNPGSWNDQGDGDQQRKKRQARRNMIFRDRNGNSVTPKPPSKDVCHPLDYNKVCLNLNNTKEVTCEPSGWAGTAIQHAINTTQHALINFRELFGFGLNLDNYMEQQEERSRQDHDITLRVEREFNSRLDNFALIADILKKILSFGLLLLVFQSYRYLKNYLAKDNYDNWYITRRFKTVDKKRLEMHGESLLPLKKQEVDSVVDLTMCGLSPMENDLYRKGLLLVVVHFLLGILCILFDTLLYWLMDMIRKHGSVEPEYSTSPGVQIIVNGNSAVAEFIQLFLDGFHARSLLRMTDRKQCLPTPHQLSSVTLLVLGSLYFIAFLLVILQAYGLRLRHKIIAYYYPQRERARTVHLYNMLVYRRSVMYRYLRRKIKARFKEQQVMKHIGCLHCLARKIPCFRIFTKWHGKLNCWGCNAPEDDSFHHCMTDQCPGLYCEECYDIIEHMCPLCQDNPESGGDFEDLDAAELKPYSISNRVYV